MLVYMLCFKTLTLPSPCEGEEKDTKGGGKRTLFLGYVVVLGGNQTFFYGFDHGFRAAAYA